MPSIVFWMLDSLNNAFNRDMIIVVPIILIGYLVFGLLLDICEMRACNSRFFCLL